MHISGRPTTWKWSDGGGSKWTPGGEWGGGQGSIIGRKKKGDREGGESRAGSGGFVQVQEASWMVFVASSQAWLNLSPTVREGL